MIKVDMKKLLADSIVDLAKTRSLEKLTVKDITDNCGAGRQTFYHHFHDKEELIGYVYTSAANECLKLFEENYTYKECIKLILDTCAEKRIFYIKAYRIIGQNSPMEIIFEHAMEYYLGLVKRKSGQNTFDNRTEMAIRFNCYGALYCVEDWIKQGMLCSSEEMADIIIENMPERLKKYL